MDKAGLTRSMSKKGCSPYNAACEGFFGRLKNEMFYGVSWIGVSIQEFVLQFDKYLHWYAKKRIKDHIGRFTKLYYQIKNDEIDVDFLKDISKKDCVFPDIDYKIYK